MPSTTIATAATIKPIVAPQYHFSWTDQDGNPADGDVTNRNGNRQLPSQHARQFYNQTRGFISGTGRIFPCNASNSSNAYTLSLQTSGPVVEQLNTHDTYGFVAPASSTGLVTATIIGANGQTIGSGINVYKNNGAAQATNGDITVNLHYLLTFVDSLNGGNGGFVLR